MRATEQNIAGNAPAVNRGSALKKNIWFRFAPAFIALSIFPAFAPVLGWSEERQAKAQKPASFEQRLELGVAAFDTKERPLVRAVLDIVYEYRLPLGLEYVDAEAVRRPLELKLKDKSVREILRAVVAQLPQYQITFAPGVVEIYSPQPRADASNLLNTVIENFEVRNQDAKRASWEVYASLEAQLQPHNAVIGNILGEVSPKISLHLRHKKVYELLGAIVTANGDSLWVPRVPPERLSNLDETPWQLFGLGAGWEELVLTQLQALFPHKK
jgi:hypothetical protein